MIRIDIGETTMYDYRLIKIKLKTKFTGLSLEPEQDYHAIIEEYSALGWRLVQIFAPCTRQSGQAEYFELIFEKQRQAGNSPGLFAT